MKPLVSTTASLFFLIAVLTACGTRATGPFFQKLEPTEQGNAIVYLFVVWNIAHTRAYPIKANGEPIVELVDGGYYPFRVAPGAVIFETDGRGQEKVRLVLNVESGQAYFVQAIRLRSGSELKLLSEEEAIHLIASCRLIIEPLALKSP